MASISQLKLPDNTIYNIKGSIHTVIGTQNASTGSWTGNLTSIDALYDGLTIAYYLPYAGSGNASLNLTLKNNTTTGAINCYLSNNTRLTTEYEQGSVIYLTYFSAGAISINGTATQSARWIAQADAIGNASEGDTAYYEIGTEEIGSASEGTEIAADDITGWTTNTPTTISYTSRSIPNVTAAGTASVSNGTLSITDTTLGTAISADDITAYTAGTAASLSYTSKLIPNISVTPVTVVTGLTPSGTLVPNVSQDAYNGLVIDHGSES